MLPVIKLNFRIMIRFLLLFQLSSPLDSFTATHFSCHLQAHLSSPTKGEKNFEQQGVIRKKKSLVKSTFLTHSLTWIVEISLSHSLLRYCSTVIFSSGISTTWIKSSDWSPNLILSPSFKGLVITSGFSCSPFTTVPLEEPTSRIPQAVLSGIQTTWFAGRRSQSVSRKKQKSVNTWRERERERGIACGRCWY